MKKIKYITPQKYWLWQALTTIIVLALIFFLVINQYAVQFYGNNFQQVAKADVQLYFFDVGQASSALVITPEKKSILFDTGSADSANSLAEDLKFVLNKNHIKTVDILILSHSDADHVGGTASIMQNFDVKRVLRPKQLSYIEDNLWGYQVVTTYTYATAIQAVYNEGCPVEFVENYCTSFGELQFEIFAPERTNYTETNSFSPFIYGQYYGKTFLLTADATAERENELLNEFEKAKRLLKVDFLQVAHHGSKYSSSENFLKAISPKYAFISAGDEAHPAQEVLARLQDVKAKTLVTKKDGMLGVGINKGRFVVCDMHQFFDVPLIVVLLCVFMFVLWHYFQLQSESSKNHGKKFCNKTRL